MSYKALLFCNDEKTARTVTQVLAELEFSVEASAEPFAAVKQLTSEHFDALVVDGDNQQNASLLFKTARTGLNQNSLAVAIVEGQSGVAKAFQIGANLVLTKPINVEQSKGTLRVARGLLRKNEGAKPSSSPVSDHTPSFGADSRPHVPEPQVTAKPSAFATQPAAFAASSSKALFEVEADPTPAPEPTEAAMLESMHDPIAGKIRKPEVSIAPPAKASPWQPISQPMAQPVATALKHADQALGTSSRGPEAVGFFGQPSSGAAAAAAPAREVSKVPEVSKIEEEIEEFGTLPPSAAQPVAAKNTPKGLIAAALLVAACAVGYYQWTRIQSRPSNFTQARTNPTNPVQSPAATTPTNFPQPNVPYSAIVTATPLPANGASASTAATSVATRMAPAASSVDTPAPAKKATTTISVGEGSKTSSSRQEVLVVNSEVPKPVTVPSAPVEDEAAPAASIVSSGSGDSAVSGLVDAPASKPQAAPHTLRISQGVSQGLLVKKVAPVYPQKALAMGIQGEVQLLATINSEGNVTNVKLLNGDAMLSRAAMDAVKQWKYKPFYLDDKPLEIQTEITVNFKAP